MDEDKVILEVGDNLTEFTLSYNEYDEDPPYSKENAVNIKLQPDYRYDRLKVICEDIEGKKHELPVDILNVKLKLVKKEW